MLRRWGRPLVLALGVATVSNLAVASANVGFSGLAWLGHLELAALQTRRLATPAAPDERILLVTIERETLQRLGVPRPAGPVPREYHAELLRLLRRAGARLVVLDLLFTSPGDPHEDQVLREALTQCAPLRVVLAAEPEPVLGAPPWSAHRFIPPVVLPEPPVEHVVSASPVAFDPGGTLHGAILHQRDAATGRIWYHLGLAAAVAGDPSAGQSRWIPSRHLVTAGPHAWPVGEDGELLVHWTAAPGSFKRLEFAETLGALSDPSSRDALSECLVIVGDAAGADTHRTPIGRMTGVEFVAQVTNTLIGSGDGRVRRCSVPVNFVWSWFLATVVAVAVSRVRPLAVTLVLLAAFALAWGAPALLYSTSRVWLDVVGPLVSVGVAAALTGLVWGMRDRSLARRFVPRRFVDHRPADQTETATVLFVDLRGSTALAERLGPERYRGALATLLTELGSVVDRRGGEVERTLGDGLLAVFRTPDDHPQRALACGAEMHRRVALLDVEAAADPSPLSIAVGLETGVISGALIRAGDREEWSSFGPTVNLARRIQEEAGRSGLPMLVGPRLAALVAGAVPLRPVGARSLKGVQEDTPLFAPEPGGV